MIVYRDVIPVVGEAVPEGCEWKSRTSFDWMPELKAVFSLHDVRWYVEEGLRFRYPLWSPSELWLNTLSLD